MKHQALFSLKNKGKKNVICCNFAWLFNPVALRKAKIAYNFGLSECNRVKGEKILIYCLLSGWWSASK